MQRELAENDVHSENEYEDLFIGEDDDTIDKAEAQMFTEIAFAKE